MAARARSGVPSSLSPRSPKSPSSSLASNRTRGMLDSPEEFANARCGKSPSSEDEGRALLKTHEFD